MFGLTGLRLYAVLGAALIVACLLAWALRLDALRGGYRADLEQLRKEAGTVVIALKQASGNDDVTWQTAPGQIVALGESNRRLKDSIDQQNATIDEMARQAVALKAKAAELQKIADKARAQRQAALNRLSDMAITPGTRSDCMILLKEANEALDLVRSAGL